MMGGGRPVQDCTGLRRWDRPPTTAWRRCNASTEALAVVCSRRQIGGRPAWARVAPPPPFLAGGAAVPPPPRFGGAVLRHDPAAPYAHAERACGAARGVTGSRARGGRMECSQHTVAGSGRAMRREGPRGKRPRRGPHSFCFSCCIPPRTGVALRTGGRRDKQRRCRRS